MARRPPRASCFSLSRLSLSPDATFRLGRELGGELVGSGGAEPPGGSSAVVALVGELGSGKTLFTKGLAAGAGVRDLDRVSSPTFVLEQVYQGLIRIHHYDLYRLSEPRELWALGFEESLEGGGLVVVEWADRVLPAMPAEALTVELEHAGPPAPVPGTTPLDAGRRRITFRGEAARWEEPVRRAVARAESR